jgi:hypothetical protein
MSYEKVLVDNLTCKRRFHLTFDSDAPKEDCVTVRCMHCQAVIFEKHDHPPVKLARDENLVTLRYLSAERTKECQFKDPYPQK